MKKEEVTTETMKHNHVPGEHPGEEHRLEHPEKPLRPEQPGRPDRPEKPITIIVNGMDKTLAVGIKMLTYEELVKLAFEVYDSSDRVVYTVVYSKGPLENKKGTLVKGEAVFVKEGMVFNVGRSDKS